MSVVSGFTDPTLGAQSVFRKLLGAMAEPGTVATLSPPLPSAPAPLAEATFALALTLLDVDTPLWLDVDDAALAQDLRFHCGAPIVLAPGKAAFAILCYPGGLARWGTFSIGTADYPDRSATLIVQVASLGTGTSLKLTGPGIETSRILHVDGLPDNFVELWDGNRVYAPQGVDLILACGRQIAGLPRTTRLEAA